MGWCISSAAFCVCYESISSAPIQAIFTSQENAVIKVVLNRTQQIQLLLVSPIKLRQKTHTGSLTFTGGKSSNSFAVFITHPNLLLKSCFPKQL